MRRLASVVRGRAAPVRRSRRGSIRLLGCEDPGGPLCTPLGYARPIDTVQFQNVAYSDADIDEILAELNASAAGQRRPTALSSTSNQEIAHLIGGAGMTSVRLACPTEHGESIELTLVDGARKRARDHAAH